MAAFLRVSIGVALAAGIFFGCAGEWRLPVVWAFLGVLATIMGIAMFTIDPGLRQERLRPGPGGRDRLMRFIAAPLILVHWAIAGLDARFHWSDSIPEPVRWGGVVGYAAALALAMWAMSVNRFFSPVVRIQHERGHHLVTGGPYRFVRHPGYCGVLFGALFGSLALGSLWAMVPIGMLLPLLVRRTIIEDRFLMTELEGYRDFAGRVRYRLLPGLW